MASSNQYRKIPNDPRQKHVSSPKSDADDKNTMMLEMALKLKRKDDLLEAALQHMQESRIEVEKLKASEYQLKRELAFHEKELEYHKVENQTLKLKERVSNDELQSARKEAINEMKNMLTHPRSSLSIKTMGELHRKAFKDMHSKTPGGKDWRKESARLWSSWDENLKNPHWHPFKKIKTDGIFQEIIDENDPKLKQLKNEGNEKVYKAVVNAVLEVNEHNPSGRYPVFEIWNNKEERRASLKEIIRYLIKQLKAIKPKRKRQYSSLAQ